MEGGIYREPYAREVIPRVEIPADLAHLPGLLLRCRADHGTNDIFHPRKRVEFHAEWLRDEPFDATTTGQLLSTGVNSLLETGNMRFGWCHSCMLSLWSTILSPQSPDN